MADPATIKTVTTALAPLTSAIVEMWIKPKIKDIGKKWILNKKLQDHFFENQFKKYLTEKYKIHSNANLIALRNQQKELKDIYQPLTLRSSKGEKFSFKVTGFPKTELEQFNRIIVVDTAGMGKSTLSKYLFLKTIEENKGIPVFIELRRLNKSKSIIDEIFNELKLLEEDIDKNFILELIKRGDFIFFFDGFDEIQEAEKEFVSRNIREFINLATNNKFILTSRPDYSLTSFGDFLGFRIQPLNKEEAFSLLKKYDQNGEISNGIIDKINELNNRTINEFLTNPLLVTLLFTAFEYKHTIPLKKNIFYRQVYDALFESHDLAKGDFYYREKYSNLNIDDFHQVLRYLAFLCLKVDKIEFSKDEILNLINKAKDFSEINSFSESDFLKDLTKTVPLFAVDGLYFKWAHKSLYEYFAASFIYLDSNENKPKILLKLVSKENNIGYFNILDLYSSIDYKNFRVIVGGYLTKKFIKYLDKKTKTDSTNKTLIERIELNYLKNRSLIQLKNDEIEKIEHKNTYIEKAHSVIFKYLACSIRISNKYRTYQHHLNNTFIVDLGETPQRFDNFQSLIDLFGRQEEIFIKRIQPPKLDDDKILFKEISKNNIYNLDFNTGNIINQELTMSHTNKLLRITYEGDFIFDSKKSKQFLSQLEISKSKVNDENFFEL